MGPHADDFHYGGLTQVSKMPGLGRWRLVVVVAPIEVGDGCLDEFIDIHAFEAIDADGVELAAERRIISPGEWPHAAMAAKDMMDFVGLIVSQITFTREQPKGIWFRNGAPHPRLGAHLAVALEGACAQINVRFKAHSAAMAAPCVCFLHSRISKRN
jgi:hypothetical protein